MKRTLYVWLAIVLVSVLAGCQSYAAEEMVDSSDQTVNTVPSIDIVDASYNGQLVDIHGGQSCCISLPAKWHPGMTATIAWTVDEHRDYNLGGIKAPPLNTQQWDDWYDIHESQYVKHKAIVPVPRYEEASGFVLIFLPCNKVVPLLDANEIGRVLGHVDGDFDTTIQQRLGAKKTCQKS